MPNLPLLLGHRGARASAHVAENTLPSFDLCLKHGCDGFEFDVRLTPGGRALICHDPKVRGVTVSRASGDQLADIPELEQLLHRYGQRAFLDIELKVKNLESKTLLALSENPPEHGVVVSSFSAEIVMALRARSGRVPLGIICEKPAQLARGRKLPVEWVIAHQSLVDQKLVSEIQAAGKQLLVWTVNRQAGMLRFADWGVDGIISDETELLVRTLRRPAPLPRGHRRSAGGSA
jgi:glycerophosphoryl diester phosphodiesterase